MDGSNLLDILRKTDFIINKSYLPILQNYPVADIDSSALLEASECTCFFPVRRLVYDKDENNMRKLASVYMSASAFDGCICMIIKGYADGSTDITLGISDNSTSRINGAYPKTKAFHDSFMGNFPGGQDGNDKILNIEESRILINSAFSREYQSAASVSCIGSLRGNPDQKNEAFYQGIEKVIDSMNGKEYTILILAQPVSSSSIQDIRSELESLYTRLSVFAKSSASLSRSEADSVSSSFSRSISDSVNTSHSLSLSVGNNVSQSGSISVSENYSDSSSVGIGIVDFSDSSSYGNTVTESQTSGKQAGIAVASVEGEGKAVSETNTDSNSHSQTQGISLQFSVEDKKISEKLEAISGHLKRIKSALGEGLFSMCAYFLSSSLSEARSAAGTYKAVVTGDKTSLEYNGINVWTGEKFRQVMKYLKAFQHPVFQLEEGMRTTPAVLVTASELAVNMSLPQHSINGIPVSSSAVFGRDITLLGAENIHSRKLNIGSIYHLGHVGRRKAELDADSLTMHTFITGTTGSGKSSTVYQIIDGIQKTDSNIKILVIEPAKGEYKTVLANRKDIRVYGINPYITPLLRINPFRFGRGIHVLEHIDKLTNIFNVCWPMEAAMPAILKQAIERAYISSGWDIQRSINKYSDRLFPDFAGVMAEVEELLDESQYSDRNKGDYKGALCTRLRELTTGLNGMIFTADDLSDSELFDENVIIDLSRVGSPETKALIMGLMVIRLQEYRQTSGKITGGRLSHLTVLEEAHHLLRKTSQVQTSDGANVAGKSVEILTNAIAEMRSSGEGFIIADQSPGLMDKTVIRNTNTKIVLRLPDAEDREMTGKAMGMTDLQISELSKLPTGVAAVYQNDWLESVLVKISRYSTEGLQYKYELDNPDILFDDSRDIISVLEAMLNPKGVDSLSSENILCMKIPARLKVQLLTCLENTEEREIVRRGRIVFELFNISEAMMKSDTSSIENWLSNFTENLKPSIADLDEWDRNTLLLIIGSEYTRRHSEFAPIYCELARRLS